MKPVFVDRRLNLGQFRDLVNQGGGVITDQGLATAAAIRGPALSDRADFLRRDQAALGPGMSRLPASFPTGGWGRRLAFEPDGIGRRRLGGIGGVELESGLKIADTSLQFSNLSLEGVHQGQDGDLGFRRDGVPERCGDGRLRQGRSTMRIG
jgi:hypothetical protein